MEEARRGGVFEPRGGGRRRAEKKRATRRRTNEGGFVQTRVSSRTYRRTTSSSSSPSSSTTQARSRARLGGCAAPICACSRDLRREVRREGAILLFRKKVSNDWHERQRRRKLGVRLRKQRASWLASAPRASRLARSPRRSRDHAPRAFLLARGGVRARGRGPRAAAGVSRLLAPPVPPRRRRALLARVRGLRARARAPARDRARERARRDRERSRRGGVRAGGGARAEGVRDARGRGGVRLDARLALAAPSSARRGRNTSYRTTPSAPPNNQPLARTNDLSREPERRRPGAGRGGAGPPSGSPRAPPAAPVDLIALGSRRLFSTPDPPPSLF